VVILEGEGVGDIDLRVMAFRQTVESDDDTKADEDGDDGDTDSWQRDPGVPVRDFFGTDVDTAGGVHVFSDFLHYFLRR